MFVSSLSPARRTRLVPAAVFAATVALCLAAGEAAATKVTFRYQPVIGGVDKVAVAGTFNDWNATANPLADADKNGVWEAVVDLKPGRYEYKFVVGETWMTDETAAEFVADPYGSRNSVVTIKDKPLVVGFGSSFQKADEGQALGLRKVTFKFRPDGKPRQVNLAGSFNDWNDGRTPMGDPDGDGLWEASLLLPTGTVQYKFVVDGKQPWLNDRDHQDSDVDDGFGGKNSVLNVDDRFDAVVVKRGDGAVMPDGIEHKQGANEVNVVGGGRVEFTARAHRGDVDDVKLVLGRGATETATSMKKTNADKVYDYYRLTVTPRDTDTTYAFMYVDGKTTQWLGPKGISNDPAPRFAYDARRFPAFETPEWVKHAVIYQIFPDRFRNGNPANDQDFKEWYYKGKTELPPGGRLDVEFQEYYHLVKDWNDNQALTKASHTKDGRDWMAFYGGDIEGVRQSLDYLKELGVTAIYFNPIFEAKSTHKYDGGDYRKVDPHFGSNEEFVAFVKEAKAKGIRTILDIVYNHSGNSHWAFKDAVEKGSKSDTYQWYEFKKWPLPAGWPSVPHAWKPADHYYCWWGFGDLPDLNFDLSRNNDAEKNIRDVREAQINVPLVNYLLDATEYWLKDVDVDGLRLDVPNEVPYWFWGLFNQRVKKVKPDAYIVGELWGNASDYVRPGMYDAVMNYAFFRDPVTRFLGTGQGSAAEFDATLATGRLTYPSQAVACQMNLIDSHDTVRFLTQVGGNVNRLKLAAMFGMTYIGAPHIYYGDEVGMEGGADPDCRRTFPWDWEKDPKRVALRDYYKKLTAARHAHAALRTGTFQPVHTQGMVYGYVRADDQEQFLVALNAGKTEAQMPVDLAAWGGKVKAVDVLTGAAESWSGKAAVKVPAETGRLFRLVRGDGSAAGN